MFTSSPRAVLPNFARATSTISICRLRDPGIARELERLVAIHLGLPVADYLGMEADAYYRLVAGAQDDMNRRGFARQIAADCRGTLRRILGTDRILVQSNLYLRAVRPVATPIQEQVDWHRESFYGPGMRHAANVWVPVANVTADTALRYIPGSHDIPDEQIVTVTEPDPAVPRLSAGHRIGLLYAPKRIVGGVDLSAGRPLVVQRGEAAIFSAELIHGAGVNRSGDIRVSVDFRAIAADNVRIRKPHAASGKSYFEEL